MKTNETSRMSWPHIDSITAHIFKLNPFGKKNHQNNHIKLIKNTQKIKQKITMDLGGRLEVNSQTTTVSMRHNAAVLQVAMNSAEQVSSDAASMNLVSM